MATNDTIRTLNTLVTLEASGISLSDGDFGEANDSDLTSADIDGMPVAIFELTTAAGGFSGAPSEGAAVHLFEQKFMTGGVNQAPSPDGAFQHDHIGTFYVNTVDTQQYLRIEGVPINYLGGTYHIQWVDGPGGSVSMDSGWSLDVTPYTLRPES